MKIIFVTDWCCRDFICQGYLSVLRIKLPSGKGGVTGSDFTEIIHRHDEDGGASYFYVYGYGGYGVGVYVAV